MSAVLGLLEFVPRWLLLTLAGLLALHGCRWELEAERAQAQAADLRAGIAESNARAAAQARALQTKVTEAQNEARHRETTLRAAADSARSELDGLRVDVDALRRQLADASHDAAVERAAAVAAVLGQCAARHQELAQRCDRHVNDIRTLMGAWPR